MRRFRAMGTDCEVTVFGPMAAALADLAVRRVELLEDCWSRFRPASELNRLNARAGTGPVEVSPDLRVLVEAMQVAWQWTDGLFDPTVLRSMRALGYDADFVTVIAREALEVAALRPAPGLADVIVDSRAVQLPAGIGLDPGAIGKGLAADIVVDELMAAGAQGVLVSLGGDIVLAGEPGDDGQWAVEVVDERHADHEPEAIMRTVTWPAPIERAAIATSTTLRRRWAGGRHHVIDPRTGDVARSDLVQATVVADSGWQAEVAATAALLLGARDGSAWLERRGLEAILLPDAQLVGGGRG